MNPGQLTDGGEMAMCLMNGLIANEESDTLDLRPIVEQYRKWIGSEPFDIDETVNSTLGLLSDPDFTIEALRHSIEATKDSTERALDATSNSSLMRISPLAVWAASIPDVQQHRVVISAEVGLTHGNELAHDAAFVYCQAIKYLLNHATENEKERNAFKHAKVLASKCKSGQPCIEKETVTEWLEIVEQMVHDQTAYDDNVNLR